MIEARDVKKPAEELPALPREVTKLRAYDGKPYTEQLNPVAIVHDAGRWYVYEAGDVIPDSHKPESEKAKA